MLKSLTVWNFALLEHVEITFGAGLNILTGETGAGKSILIDALGAVLGRRVTADAIRTGCDWLRVEAVFDVSGQDALLAYLAEQAIDCEDATLIITRQVARAGRNNVLVNGCHVTLAVLKALGTYLVDVHGQNENLALLKEANQYDLLDHERPAVTAAWDAYRAAFHAWTEKRKELAARKQDARDVAQRLDMLHWQDQEIEDAKLQPGEDERLEEEIRKLSHAEKISDNVQDAYRLLASDSRSGLSVLSALAGVKKALEDVARYDGSLTNAQKIVEETEISLQEASYEIRDYGESMDFSPQRLDQLQSRMDTIDKLCKKYGATVADVLEHQASVQKELADIANYDDDIAALEAAIRTAEAKLRTCAETLTNERKRSAAVLTKDIGAQLAALGMPKARFAIEIVPLAGKTATRKDTTPAQEASAPTSMFGPRGADQVLMTFSANPGEAPKPLAKVASGGELSRIALAIKAVSASRDDAVPSMVFDEIDTGIGGRTAQMVAERIALVAQYKQVLCITHLPQIACMADVHLYIAKHSEGGHTLTQVHRLTEAQQINEIARMASGSDVSAASLDNAREMVAHARQKKASFAKHS
ncbi:DNA repair protein RecN [uncultured Selenomonas sp.]|uniref:DNA repair protein RecN n=1 Tax=uncultured Selenomonas sp. TaxID=159275 RepID=UPI0025F7B2F6|nr:DNA repair protein RecN [uncultured Selenomonas sp.]